MVPIRKSELMDFNAEQTRNSAIQDLHPAELNQPKYERLKRHLLAEMTSGRLKPGDALPSELRMAEQHEISRNTVRQAISELKQDGLIHQIRGKGTFVNKEALRRLRRGLAVFALITIDTQTLFYPSLLKGFESAAAKKQKQVLICSTDNDPYRQCDIILQLLDKEVNGVAIVPAQNPDTQPHQVRQLQKQGIPVVFCHRRVEGIHAPLLAIDFWGVGRIAGEAVLKKGHRRVALLVTGRGRFANLLEDSMRATLRAGGSDLPEYSVQRLVGKEFQKTDLSDAIQFISKMLRDLWDKPEPPTAIVCSNDQLAEVVYLQLHKMGLRVPEDVSLVGFGGTSRDTAMSRQLTSVTIDEVELGSRAAELLDEICSGTRPMDDTEEIIMPLSLSDGLTLGPAPE